jgi:chromosome segregation ATPase
MEDVHDQPVSVKEGDTSKEILSLYGKIRAQEQYLSRVKAEIEELKSEREQWSSDLTLLNREIEEIDDENRAIEEDVEEIERDYEIAYRKSLRVEEYKVFFADLKEKGDECYRFIGEENVLLDQIEAEEIRLQRLENSISELNERYCKLDDESAELIAKLKENQLDKAKVKERVCFLKDIVALYRGKKGAQLKDLGQICELLDREIAKKK